MAEAELVRDPTPEPFWPAGLPRPQLEMESGDGFATFVTRFESAYRHGPWTMAEVLRRPTAELSQLAGRRGEDDRLQWSGALFLDLEAGVHPRGGVCVFLAGLGRLGEDGFEVRQFIARTELEEHAVLAAVARAAAGASDLVTFAGRSFDAPLLTERSRSEGIDLALPPRHFDLYRMSTKLLRRRFLDEKLVTLERELLRYEREQDLPGPAMPNAWRSLHLSESSHLLMAVLRHNLLDVVSLPALAAELSLRLESPDEALEQGRLTERDAQKLEGELAEAREALAVAPPHRRESARRRVRRLERRLAQLRGDDAPAGESGEESAAS